MKRGRSGTLGPEEAVIRRRAEALLQKGREFMETHGHLPVLAGVVAPNGRVSLVEVPLATPQNGRAVAELKARARRERGLAVLVLSDIWYSDQTEPEHWDGRPAGQQENRREAMMLAIHTPTGSEVSVQPYHRTGEEKRTIVWDENESESEPAREGEMDSRFNPWSDGARRIVEKALAARERAQARRSAASSSGGPAPDDSSSG